MGRILKTFMALALLGGASSAQAQNDLERHKIDIYVETLRAIQDSQGTFEQKRDQLDRNIYYTAICSVEREFLYGITGEPALAADAAQLQNHYGYLAEAMERIGRMSAAKTKSEFQAMKPESEAFVKNIYTKGSNGSDPEAKAQMLTLSDICRQVTLAARTIDAMALER